MKALFYFALLYSVSCASSAVNLYIFNAVFDIKEPSFPTTAQPVPGTFLLLNTTLACTSSLPWCYGMSFHSTLFGQESTKYIGETSLHCHYTENVTLEANYKFFGFPNNEQLRSLNFYHNCSTTGLVLKVAKNIPYSNLEKTHDLFSEEKDLLNVGEQLYTIRRSWEIERMIVERPEYQQWFDNGEYEIRPAEYFKKMNITYE